MSATPRLIPLAHAVARGGGFVLVAAELWDQAYDEVEAYQREHGRPIYGSQNAPTPNFLLKGVPVVRDEAL